MQASVVHRKPVQIIVMSVTVVTLPVFIELLRDAACTLSRDRHVIVMVSVTRRNALPKRLIRRRDGDDVHDGPLRAYSRQGAHLYFVGPYPFNLPDEPDAQSKESRTYAIFEAISGVGFVQSP
jgi:hypothetical protein